jgi:hypothetical protein
MEVIIVGILKCISPIGAKENEESHEKDHEKQFHRYSNCAFLCAFVVPDVFQIPGYEREKATVHGQDPILQVVY